MSDEQLIDILKDVRTQLSNALDHVSDEKVSAHICSSITELQRSIHQLKAQPNKQIGFRQS